jgi:hypothetical protein
LIWIARKSNTEWDVQRITSTANTVKSIQSYNNDTQMLINFNLTHSFVKNDYVAIRNSQFTDFNGVYQVQEVPSSNSIIINFLSASRLGSAITVLADESTYDTYGDVYKFVSVRLASMNNVNDHCLTVITDSKTSNEVNGDRVFVDNVGSNWKIYEKVDAYTPNF